MTAPSAGMDRRQILVTAAIAPLVARQGVPTMQHALNFSFHGPSSRAIVFADAMLRARELEPTGTRIFSDVEIPGGELRVEWGHLSGNVRLIGDVRETARGPYSASYEIQRSSKPLYVRWDGEFDRIRVWLPGVAGRTWWPPFVALLRQMRPAALRTLDWTRTNEGIRPRDARTQWVVSPESQVALANRVGCGLHYTIPVNMPEPALIELLETLRETDGELTCEVGNELWNSSFPAYRWLEQQPGRHVDAAAREIDRVLAVVAREAPAARHYVGGHLGNPWYLRTLLSLVSARVDDCGPAVYMHPRGVPASGEVFAQACIDTIETLRPKLAEHKQIADARGARLVVYEWGQHADSGGTAVAEAQHTNTMAAAVRACAQMMGDEGVAVATSYSFMTSQTESNVAPFGFFDRISPPWPPKARALLDIMRSA